MDSTRRRSIALATLTTLLLAACGGGTVATSGPGGPRVTGAGTATQGPGGGPSTQAPGGGETVDGCTLLTEADIRDVTGFDTTSSTSGPQFGIFPSGCEWELIDDESIVPPSIGLGVMTTGGRAYYDQYFAPFNEEYGYEAIEGLGDEAVEDDTGAVLVVSGDAFFNLQYLGGGFGGDDTAISTELARKVVANLGG